MSSANSSPGLLAWNEHFISMAPTPPQQCSSDPQQTLMMACNLRTLRCHASSHHGSASKQRPRPRSSSHQCKWGKGRRGWGGAQPQPQMLQLRGDGACPELVEQDTKTKIQNKGRYKKRAVPPCAPDPPGKTVFEQAVLALLNGNGQFKMGTFDGAYLPTV
eukprot:1158300-Pelagomonas_calceolata.AAC.7